MKHLLGLFLMMTMSTTSASQDDLDHILSLEQAAKEIALKQRREFVNSSITSTNLDLICMLSTSPDFKAFKNMVNHVRQSSNDQDIKNMTYAEFAYYVDCEYQLNPFFTNIHYDNFQNSSAGLSNATLEMIRSMAPLLLEKGPNGQTPKEFIAARVAEIEKAFFKDKRNPARNSLLGAYTSIRNNILIEIRNYENRQTEQ